jgi:hypothetical protein
MGKVPLVWMDDSGSDLINTGGTGANYTRDQQQRHNEAKKEKDDPTM